MPRIKRPHPDDHAGFRPKLAKARRGLDVQQIEDEVRHIPSLDQQGSDLLHINEEQEELLTSRVGDQLNGIEETEITKLQPQHLGTLQISSCCRLKERFPGAQVRTSRIQISST
ncbi:uncharacterized protein LOC115797788 isoform X4 [Archocentrus centrarchus]|uniref:uncharacterized protein LOC115797788 isoform X4 n=1 Tax=Archocentrus centrarchus TaxID=63155 RepID=UPI0011EA2679|nr:uncharacterized protein LOC115797788 isoform X4 [Archocentrus centrarchus]